jgi:hypothetical protein
MMIAIGKQADRFCPYKVLLDTGDPVACAAAQTTSDLVVRGQCVTDNKVVDIHTHCRHDLYPSGIL